MAQMRLLADANMTAVLHPNRQTLLTIGANEACFSITPVLRDVDEVSRLPNLPRSQRSLPAGTSKPFLLLLSRQNLRLMQLVEVFIKAARLAINANKKFTDRALPKFLFFSTFLTGGQALSEDKTALQVLIQSHSSSLLQHFLVIFFGVEKARASASRVASSALPSEPLLCPFSLTVFMSLTTLLAFLEEAVKERFFPPPLKTLLFTLRLSFWEKISSLAPHIKHSRSSLSSPHSAGNGLSTVLEIAN